MKNTHRARRSGLLTVSVVAATTALIAGCGGNDGGTEVSVPSTTPASSSPASSVPQTSPPSVGPTSVRPSSQAPAGGTSATPGEGSRPSQTVSGGNSAPNTTVRTPSPPTGDSLPGDDAGPQGNPGSPGRN